MNSLTLPNEINNVFEEIITLPFYHDGNVYRYAKHLLFGEDNPSQYQLYIQSETKGRGSKAFIRLFEKAIKQLNELEIPQQDYEQWLFNQSDIRSVKEYKQLIHQLYGEINLITYSEYMDDDYPEIEKETSSYSDITRTYLSLKPLNNREELLDLDKPTEDNKDTKEKKKRMVLNRNNPFADVSIEDQTFLYASDDGGFKTLELNTSYTMTRAQKNEERSFLALQPGFKIRTSSRIDGRSESDITFDDTLTTEIAQDDDKVYIYLDAMHD